VQKTASRNFLQYGTSPGRHASKTKREGMPWMQQFLMIAAAHFLALLSPGPDFFLIARTSLSSGWRVASGACAGIAMANGAFIIAAFTGVSALRADSMLFIALQLTGCAYLLYLGVVFVRSAGAAGLAGVARSQGALTPARSLRAWRRAAGMGFLSGILNPKNALFYASLAAMLTGPHASAAWKTIYGTWMFCAVLLWDLSVAAAIGNQAALRGFARALPWLERASGVLLILLAAGVIVALMLRVMGLPQGPATPGSVHNRVCPQQGLFTPDIASRGYADSAMQGRQTRRHQRPFFTASATASPISCVPTRWQPGCCISGVR
jgi:threonine/homoserine/homoserine lactone efflux protein